MNEILRKRLFRCLLLPLLVVGFALGAIAQPATVSRPFAVGTGNCGSGTQMIHYYNYNPNSNGLTSDITMNCIPQLRIGGTPSGGSNRFTSNVASISYNPKDGKLYYLWTGYSGGVARTYAWSWPIGTCAGTTTNRLDTMRSFAYDILGVAFDADGNGWMLEFSTASAPYQAYLRSIDFTTGVMGARDNLSLTGGVKIWNASTGDVTISPSGQMYFVVNNKLFTPDYKSYTGTGSNLTTTYIDTVRTSGNLIGLTYADGEMIGTWSGSGCPFNEINPLTGARTNVTKAGGTQAASDLATVISGIGAAKNLVSVTPTGNTDEYTVEYDVVIHNYGNVPVTNVKVMDDLAGINGTANVTLNSVVFMSNPAGLTLNPAYDGKTNTQLISSGTINAWPVANNNATIRITCTLSGIQSGRIYNNSAVITANGFKNVALRDSSTNGTEPDLNSNDKPDDVGESQPTPLLISVTAQTPPCSALQRILYLETFGTGANTTSLAGANSPTTEYTGSTTQPLVADRYMLTSNANNGDNARWSNLQDHTTGAGRMMVVNADADNKVFFKDEIPALCPGQQYSMFFYAAFIGNSSYSTVCDAFGGFKYPRVMMTIRDAVTNLVITQISTTDITNTDWQQYGLKWVMPPGFTNGITFELSNNAPGGCGNDLAIDDIQLGSCDALPSVSTTAPSAGCLGGTTVFWAQPNDPAVIPGPKDFQWQMSTDGVTWSNLGGVTPSQAYVISPLTATYVGKYYRVIMAAQGNLASVNCRDTSNAFQLTGKTASTAPTSVVKNRIRVCPGESVTLRVNGGTPGSNGVYRWYAAGCGTGASIGSGTTITVNPTSSTTYYVRLEDDCGVTSCVSVSVPVICDIDSDDDGILDLDETGGLNPFLDDDFDGIENYRDANTPGFVDALGDGIDDRYDRDLDGKINALDLDSDNDGVPDVVEAGGVDADGDGKIDNFSDADSDGLSDNVDAVSGIAGSLGLGLTDIDGDGIPNQYDLDSDNDGIPDIREAFGVDSDNNGKVDVATDADGDGFADIVDQDSNNDGIMDVAQKALLRTGADSDGNGRPDSYPYKNLDKDARPNLYDLDSDGDGITDVREAGFPDTDNNGLSDGARGATTGWSTTIDGLSGPLSFRNSDVDPGSNNPDYLDIDSDNDGIPDNVEAPPTSNYQIPLGFDSDGDGIDNRYDNLNGFGGNGMTPNDNDSDGIPDYLDLDSDTDGQPDVVEGNDFNGNGKPDDNVTLSNIDTDGDGLDDRFDADNASSKGTSQYMGTFGTVSGDASPGSRSTLQSKLTGQPNRDWRYMGSVLDVNILNFSGTRQGETVKLTWRITSDKPVTYFIVERSTDATHFSKIAEVPGAADLNLPVSFGYNDDISTVNATVLYYRVTVVSPAGGQKTTQIYTVKRQGNNSLSINPNPASNYVTISLGVKRDELIDVQVLDAAGRVVLKQKQQIFSGSNTFPLEGVYRLSEGVYNVMVKTGDEIQYRKLIIQR